MADDASKEGDNHGISTDVFTGISPNPVAIGIGKILSKLSDLETKVEEQQKKIVSLEDKINKLMEKMD